MVVDLVHMALWDRIITEEATWQAVILITKRGGNYRGIGLVEAVWKAVAVILNCPFTASTTYQNSLHGFQLGCGTGTTTIGVKLIQQVTAMMEAVLQAIFLELNKAYDALDQIVLISSSPLPVVITTVTCRIVRNYISYELCLLRSAIPDHNKICLL